MSPKKPSVTEQVMDYLRTQIESGEWKIGQLIPSEARLCETLGVSRSSVRTALSRFAALGILHSEQGRGSYLCSDDVASRFDNIESLQYRDFVDIFKVLQFRLLIEPYAAYECARLEKGALAHLVEGLASHYVAMQQSVNDRHAFVTADMAFHTLIASSCGNELVSLALSDVIGVTPRTNEQMNVAFGYDTGIYHHGRLLEALSHGNAELAKSCMYEHLKSAIDSLVAEGVAV